MAGWIILDKNAMEYKHTMQLVHTHKPCKEVLLSGDTTAVLFGIALYVHIEMNRPSLIVDTLY